MRVLKVFCPDCGGRATIKKTNRKHRLISDVYCACNNVECGHTFVLNLIFSHTLSPSAKSTDRLVFDMMKMLTPEQKELALNFLRPQA